MSLRNRLAIERAAMWLEDVAKEQTPFATAKTLTQVAKMAQNKVRRAARRRFTLRSKWVETGIRIKPATKKNPIAYVGSRDEFMIRQELGGTKRPARKTLAIPNQVRRTKTGKIGKANRPAELMKKPGTFIKSTKGGGAAIFQRISKKSRKVRRLYNLAQKARVPARFGMEPTIKTVFKRKYPKEFEKNLAHAVATSKHFRR